MCMTRATDDGAGGFLDELSEASRHAPTKSLKPQPHLPQLKGRNSLTREAEMTQHQRAESVLKLM